MKHREIYIIRHETEPDLYWSKSSKWSKDKKNAEVFDQHDIDPSLYGPLKDYHLPAYGELILDRYEHF